MQPTLTYCLPVNAVVAGKQADKVGLLRILPIPCVLLINLLLQQLVAMIN